MARGKPGKASQDCWVAPDGKITWAYEDAEGNALGSHSVVAEDVLGDKTGGAELEAKGYLHISYSNIYPGYHEERGHIPPTQAQIDAVFDLATTVEEFDPGHVVARRFRQFIEKHQVTE